MKTIGVADHGRNNNFNLIRMVAAVVVLMSHSVLITYGRSVPEPLEPLTGYSLGEGAVVIFFAVSGYFITKSFDRRIHLTDFVLARAARIFPGLVVALCLTAFVAGPALTTLPLGAYFAQLPTWTYVPQNSALFHQQFALPGLFMENPFRGVANASLWTLKFEVLCYTGVVLAGFVGILNRRLFPTALGIAAVASVAVPGPGMGLGARVTVLCVAFAVGAGIYVYRERVPISGVLAVALLGIMALAHGTRLFPLCYAVSLGYVALAFGFASVPLLHPYNRLGDYSYGMYIYAFPIGQAVRAILPEIGPLGLIAVNFPLALVCAVASWHVVENPILLHRHRLAAKLRLRRVRRERVPLS